MSHCIVRNGLRCFWIGSLNYLWTYCESLTHDFKNGFVTPLRHFQYLFVPFGLSSAPSTFPLWPTHGADIFVSFRFIWMISWSFRRVLTNMLDMHVKYWMLYDTINFTQSWASGDCFQQVLNSFWHLMVSNFHFEIDLCTLISLHLSYVITP
jgi:hypothetical protein